MAKVASIVPGPSTGGFERAARPTTIEPLDWAESAKFVAGPADPPNSFVNRQSECDDLLDDERSEIANLEDKIENSTYTEAFYPWPIYEIQSCVGDDIVTAQDFRRVEDKLNSVRSSKAAKEISDGIWSGSPSFRSSAVPLSDTAYALNVAIARLLDARMAVEAPGPHIIHLPLVLAPFAQGLRLASSQDYTIVFDNYVKSYIPAQNVTGTSSKATAPTTSQAWAAITGPYEFAYSEVDVSDVQTVDARRANKKLVRAEQQLFFRYETANTFLAKVTVFS